MPGEEGEEINGYPDGVGRHERKTDEAVTLVPRERVRQLTAKQIGDGHQLLEETVQAVTLFPCERVQ